MRIVRRFFAAFILTSALAMSIHAGVISTPDDPPPPAVPAQGETSTTANGNMHTGDSDGATAGDVVAEAALSLLQGVLSLL